MDRSRVAYIEDFVEEALKIIELADQEGIILRIIGSIAVKLHCKEHYHIHDALNREITDIDFMTSSKNRGRLKTFLPELGLVPNERFNYFHGISRLIYFDSRERTVDIFFDKLEMAHTINFADRLQVDLPTIPLAELLLTKLQVVQINEKDIKDTIVLLREHAIEDADNETINIDYVCKVLSKDWGFYHTFMTNLQKVSVFAEDYERELDEINADDIDVIKDKIAMIKKRVEDEPKSIAWKTRSRIGTRRKWYKDVEEIGR